MIAWGGQDFLNFWEIQISKKKYKYKFLLQFHAKCYWFTVCIQYEYSVIIGKMNFPNFQEILTPFFDVSKYFSSRLLLRVFQKLIHMLNTLKTLLKKAIFRTGNHQFLLYCINVFRFHLGVVWKRWEKHSIHVTIWKFYATNSATADGQEGC